MRLPILSFVFLAAASIGEIQAAWAQSPTSYPWCSRSPIRGGAVSCYYTSYEQCRTTQSGIGGICLQNPYTRLAPVHAPPAHPRRHRPT
jgi:hypothetical protein